MYNIVKVPPVNTAVRFMEILGFSIPTVNEAFGFKEIFLTSLSV